MALDKVIGTEVQDVGLSRPICGICGIIIFFSLFVYSIFFLSFCGMKFHDSGLSSVAVNRKDQNTRADYKPRSLVVL